VKPSTHSDYVLTLQGISDVLEASCMIWFREGLITGGLESVIYPLEGKGW